MFEVVVFTRRLFGFILKGGGRGFGWDRARSCEGRGFFEEIRECLYAFTGAEDFRQGKVPYGLLQDVSVLVESWAFSQDVIPIFQGPVVAGAGYWVRGKGEEGAPEVTGVGVAGPALDDAAKHFSVVL